MAMLSMLIEATGHQLILNVEPLPIRRLGLPDTPLGRRLRRHRRAVIDVAERRGIGNIRVVGSAVPTWLRERAPVVTRQRVTGRAARMRHTVEESLVGEV